MIPHYQGGGVRGPAGATGATGAAGPANLTVSVLAANATNSTAAMAATGLTVNVTSGHRYAFRAVLMLSDSSALGVGGGKVDFDGGTATSTNFRAWAWDNAAAFASGVYYTTLAADIESSSTFLDLTLVIEGSFEPATSGTFAPRFAQMAAGDGAITLFRGSHLSVWES